MTSVRNAARPTRERARRTVWIAAVALLASVAVTDRAAAQLFEIPDTYAGDLASRYRLTGDWFGTRDQLARRGIVLDFDLLQTLQGVASGGQDQEVTYGGSADYTLQVDFDKLGLWPGAFLKLHAESSYGESVNRTVGALGAVNGDALFPGLGENTTALSHLTYIQFLHPKVGLFLGKVEGYDADANAFADDHRTKFLNLGFDFNLVNALVPISAFGGGVILVPWEGALITAAVLDPDGTPKSNDLGDAFADGVFVATEGRVAIKPFGLLGHQLLGFTWSNKNRLSLDQDPANLARLFATERFPRLNDPGPLLDRILQRFFPGLLVPTQAARREDETWALYYNFDQYVWQPGGDPDRGLGVFFRFGVSDGKANPVKYHYNVGVGGKGVVPGRPRDTFGIGWSRLEFSDDFAPFLRQQLRLGLEREDAVELFYNVAVTPWLQVTLDLQIVEPALQKRLNPSGELESIDTAVIGGLRVYARF